MKLTMIVLVGGGSIYTCYTQQLDGRSDNLSPPVSINTACYLARLRYDGAETRPLHEVVSVRLIVFIA